MLIELAYRMGLINQQTFQKYMMLALNLAYTTLKDTYLGYLFENDNRTLTLTAIMAIKCNEQKTLPPKVQFLDLIAPTQIIGPVDIVNYFGVSS